MILDLINKLLFPFVHKETGVRYRYKYYIVTKYVVDECKETGLHLLDRYFLPSEKGEFTFFIYRDSKINEKGYEEIQDYAKKERGAKSCVILNVIKMER